MFENYKSTPIGSLLTRDLAEENRILDKLPELPPGIVHLVMSNKTGAFIRGLIKTYNISPQLTSQLAFLVLQVAVGEKTFAQFPVLLSAEIKVPNDKANAMAKEIEKDLFAPIALELNQYLAKKKQQGGGKSMADKLADTPTPPPAPKTGPTPIVKRGAPLKPQNVLNLREQRRPPTSPPAPKR